MTDLQIKMHEMAHTDALTGLYNRRSFHEQLEKAIEKRSMESGVTLAVFDLDGFKQINDRYGHLTGDKMLQIAADRLRNSVGKFGQVSRLGGDEFSVLFKGQPAILCRQLIEAAMQKLQMPAVVDGKHMRVGASFGLTSVDYAEDVQAVSLISQADLLLYKMKKQKSGQTARSGEIADMLGSGRAA